MGVRVIAGDCREVLAGLDANSVDASVTDPPYGLEFMGKEWDAPWQVSSSSALFGARDRDMPGWGVTRNPTCRGCGGRLRGANRCACAEPQWDEAPTATKQRQMRAFQAWCEEWAAELYRVLKPGAHLVIFGGTRTYHRMACAIEDTGFEIRDMLVWHYGTGFPKSHNVSKGIDKAAGAERPIVVHRTDGPSSWMLAQKIEDRASGGTGIGFADGSGKEYDVTGPATDAARQWAGWGTALKPATEPIVLARKPLSEGTVAANVLKWGTGALNIDGCRVGFESESDRASAFPGGKVTSHGTGSLAGPGQAQDVNRAEFTAERNQTGRWPANLVHDSSDEVLACFPDSAGQQGDVRGTEPSEVTNGIYGKFKGRVASPRRDGEASAERRYTEEGATNFAAMPGARRSDGASAARFFFSAKADKEDRWGSRHPTVKPVELIRWLIRLVTPPGGTVIDPFAGSGTAGVAALAERVDAILIERDPTYVADIRARMAFYEGGGQHSVAAKARSAVPRGTLPLFE